MFKDPKAQYLMKDLDQLMHGFRLAKLQPSDRKKIEKMEGQLTLAEHQAIDRGRFDVIKELNSVLSKYR